MPRNKDFKRLVRSRMQKTGESYTAARAVLVDQTSPSPRTPRRSARSTEAFAAPPQEWPALAGMSDRAVQRKTGRTWEEWVAVLEEAKAFEMSHRDIARYLHTSFEEVDSWWAQTVTVGYERIRGLRDVGQRRGGTYDANKSRTYPVGVSALYQMFKDSRKRKRWLSGGWKRVRTSIDDRSLRVDWEDGTQVNLYFESKGPQKSTVTVQHGKLEKKADVARAKEHWQERLDHLRDTLLGQA